MSIAAVASGHEVTTQVAQDLLLEGANAFDALTGAFFAACVAEPVLASAGGGAFILAQPNGQRTRIIDAFATTPSCKPSRHEMDVRAVTVDFGATTQTYHIGNGTIAVPGAIKGLFNLHAQLGYMPMRDIVAPAVALAQSGTKITDQQGTILRAVEPVVSATPAARKLFLRNDQLLSAGDHFSNPRFADFLEVLAIEGDSFFYRGEVAAVLEQARSGRGGCVGIEDLGAYESRLRDPVEFKCGDATIQSAGPPSAGGLLIGFGLALVEGLQPVFQSLSESERSRTLVDVMKATSAARVHATTDSFDFPDESILFDPQLVHAWQNEISERVAVFRGTTHINVLDAKGNIACLSTSNGEGSGEVIEDAGIMMNNMLGEDDLNPRGIGAWSTKTPMTSMMAPTLMQYTGGRRVMMGSGGSNRIRTAMLQVILNIEKLDMSLEEAIHASRIHIDDDHVYIEAGFEGDVVDALTEQTPAHTLFEDRSFYFGGVHAIDSGPNGIVGAGDPRRGGASRVFSC